MKLRDYIDKYKLNITKFAAECDTSVAYLYCLMAGKKKPRQALSERIEKGSDGLVSVMELRGKDDRLKRKNIDDRSSEENVWREDASSDLPSDLQRQIES